MGEASKRRFVVNVLSNGLYVVLNALLMVWYVPFLVRHLGMAAYGSIPLANSIVMYTAVITASLDTSINRFLAIDLNKHDIAGANRTFNAALALSFVASGLLLVPAVFLTIFFPRIFEVPAGLELASQFLFASTVLTTLASLFSSNFGVAAVVTHRFDLRNIVRSLTSLSRVGVVWFLFLFMEPSLWQVSLGFAISAMVGLLGDMILWRLLTPELNIDLAMMDRSQFRALSGLSGWVTVSVLGSMLLMQIDLVVVNAIFGPEMTGKYGSLLLFPSLIYTMLGVVVSVLSPAIMAQYAVGDVDGIRRLAARSVKWLGIVLALPVGLLCGLGQPLLALWLGPDFASLHMILVLLVCHLTINLAVRPLSYIVNAYNRAKGEALATFAFGICNVVAAVAVAKWGPWGAVGVAAVGAVAFTLRNAVFMSAYSALVMGLPWWSYYQPLVGGAFGTLCVSMAGFAVSRLWWPDSWVTLGAAAAVVSTAYLALAYVFWLDHYDRQTIMEAIGRGRARSIK